MVERTLCALYLLFFTLKVFTAEGERRASKQAEQHSVDSTEVAEVWVLCEYKRRVPASLSGVA